MRPARPDGTLTIGGRWGRDPGQNDEPWVAEGISVAMSAKTAECYGSGTGLTDCGEGMASMNARWANPGDTGPIALERVQQSLTVDMVMTLRPNVQTRRGRRRRPRRDAPRLDALVWAKGPNPASR